MKTSIYCVALAVLLASCNQKTEIKVYRVSKAPLEESMADQQNAMPTNAGSPAAPGGMARAVSGTIAIPPSWESQPLSQMRQASFLIKGANGTVADISLVSLGAAAGNVLENVNRWLSQLGQPPITEEKLSQIVQRLTTAIGEVTIVDLAGLPNGADPAKDGRIIAAMTTTDNSTLFFKIRGNSELTEAQKADFIKWVTAVCNSQAQTKSPEMTTMAPPPRSETGQVKWKTPAGWTEVPASSMRYASFTTSDANGGKIDISVVTFPGDGGSDADNVNRWRQQIGLPPVDESGLTSNIVPLKSADITFSTIDIASTDTRTLAAWTRRDGNTWFFKATGPSAAVEKEKAKFMQFIQSVRF
jgi:hypothetical protein